jgi:hypothetical protein
MSELKPFSKDLYDENEFKSKEIAKEFLESTGFYSMINSLEEQEEKYKEHDFEIFLINPFTKIAVEVERKKVWTKSGKWQGWNSIDVPYRKKDSKSNLFIMINKNFDTLAITNMKNILNADVYQKKTIYTNEESFFKVDINNFKIYFKNKDSWDLIKDKK